MSRAGWALFAVLALAGSRSAMGQTVYPGAPYQTRPGVVGLGIPALDLVYLRLDGSNSTVLGIDIPNTRLCVGVVVGAGCGDTLTVSRSSAGSVFGSVLNTNTAGIAAQYAGNGAVFAVARAYGTTSVSQFLATNATASAVFAGSGASHADVRYGSDSAVPVIFGNVVERLRFTAAGNVVINEISADIDTRIESDGNANAVFVDGGNNCVGIMTATCASAVPLNVAGAAAVSGNASIGGIIDPTLSDTSAGDITNATTTFVDIVSITLPTGVHSCSARAIASNDLDADGMKFSLDSSALTATGQLVGVLQETSPATTTARNVSSPPSTTAQTTGAGFGSGFVTYDGVYIVTSGGTLKLRAALQAATTGTLTVRTGASLICRRVSA
jgi:hypothetical protein